MKKIIYYIIFMILLVIGLPSLVIVNGSGNKKNVEAPKNVRSIKRENTKQELSIKVFVNGENQIKEMFFEEYLKGVVAAEMPAEFELEALKAQAVAARTYAYAKFYKDKKDDVHVNADVCTDFAHCQAWISKENAFKDWDPLLSDKYWAKIENAVKETKDQILTYHSSIVEQAVFHANSGGKTENAEDVWAGQVPYLRSVQSFGEEASKDYKTAIKVRNKEFYDKLKSEYPTLKLNTKDPAKEIKILNYSEGGRIKTIGVGNITINGTDFRRIFSLKSTNFKIERDGTDALKITTVGNGHGVGMSQWGANYLARNGGSYEEILKYYYQGIEIGFIDDLQLPAEDFVK